MKFFEVYRNLGQWVCIFVASEHCLTKYLIMKKTKKAELDPAIIKENFKEVLDYCGIKEDEIHTVELKDNELRIDDTYILFDWHFLT